MKKQKTKQTNKQKTKGTKKCVIKQIFKFKDYWNCLEATQFKNETRHLESKKPDVDSLKEKHKEFIKNNIKITAKI